MTANGDKLTHMPEIEDRSRWHLQERAAILGFSILLTKANEERGYGVPAW